MVFAVEKNKEVGMGLSGFLCCVTDILAPSVVR